MEQAVTFESFRFGKRLKSMLRVDFRRMFRSRLFYIIIACALVMPILMTVSLITPLGSTLVNVALCLAGGALFACGLGAISKTVLNKTSLV